MKRPPSSSSVIPFICPHTSGKAAPTPALETGFWLLPTHQGGPTALASYWLRDGHATQFAERKGAEGFWESSLVAQKEM